MKNNRTILGLGYCNIDYLCMVPRIPLDDKVQTEKILEQGGGPTATALYAAVRLGAKAAFIGTVGDDQRGQAILKGLALAGVDTTGIRLRLGAESPVAFCWIKRNTGERSIAWSNGSARPLLPEELDAALIRNTGLLHLDGHHTDAAVRAAEIAHDAGVTVMLDAGTVVPRIDELLALADIIIASEKFTERFIGLADPETALHKLFGKNTKFAAVTLGKNGSIGWDGKITYRQAAFPVKTVDTTGAGDVFHGAFAYQYVNGGDWQECMRFAAAVAALKCTQLGGRSGIPTLVEAKQFLSEHKND
ncbi:MAG: PfkB family carbohydrate kinase [Victivallales bacterium]